MASDLVVALARATQDGHTFFGHNCNRPRGDAPSLHLVCGRESSLGDTVQLTHVRIPEARRTWAVLGGRAGREPGLQHGVNEKGVAVGCTPIATRLGDGEPGLTGPELVQLALERAASARQAIDVLTDLIGRHGQAKGDSAFLVADHGEAYLLEAAGRHWVLALVGQVRAVSGVCLLRQDWDRISRGLSDLAIERGWWPQDGCKLDFAGTVGEEGPDHLPALRRWGQATLRLEEHSGRIDAGFLRQLLGDLAEAVCPVDTPAAAVEQTSGSLLVRLGPRENDVPVAWYAFGSPQASVYLPVFPMPGLPAAFTDDYGLGSRLWRQLQQWQADCRHDPHVRAALHTALAGLQQSLDEHLHEFLGDAAELMRKGQADALPRLAGSFMQHCCDRFEDLAGNLRGHGPESGLKRPHSEELVGAAF